MALPQAAGAGAPAPTRANHAALGLALGYAVAAGAWILGSDWLLGWLVHDPVWLVRAGALKGWLFVAFTAVLLYLLARRGAADEPPAAGKLAAAAPAGWRARSRALALPATIVALTALALWLDFDLRRGQLLRQIEAVAAQQSGQLGTWFSYRQSQARFLRSSTFYTGLYARWRAGDATAIPQLMARVVSMREAFGNRSALVFDEDAALIAAEDLHAEPASAALREAVRQSLRSGEILQIAGGSRGAGTAWLDMVVPVFGQGGTARLAVVLRADLDDFVLPLLRNWPSGLRTGTTVLARHEGDALVPLLDDRPVPASRPGLLAGQVIAGRLPPGRAAEGLDLQGAPVFGAARPVPGSGWILMAQMDATELRAEALKDSLWIAALGVLALLGAAARAAARRERRARQQAQARQAAQEERMRALALVRDLADSSSDVIFAKDLQGRYTICNREFSRQAGVPVEAALGRDDGDFFPAEQAALIRAHDAAVLADQRVHTYEETLNTSDGLVTFLATKGPLRDADGRVVGLFGISRDITERKRAEEALRAATAQLGKLRLAVDQSPVGIAIRDLDGRIEYVNDAFSRITGVGATQALGQLGHELQPLRMPAHRLEAMAQALSEGQVWTGEFLTRRHDGTRYEELIHAAPIRQDGGRITHELWIVEDVTEKKRIAAELEHHRHRLQELIDERTRQLRRANADLVQARDRADAANQAKSAFLANMSHELRTPLNAILGLTHLLRRDAQDPVQSQQLGRIGDAASRLLQLLNDLLDLSRIEAGRLPLCEGAFSLRALLAGCAALVAEAAQAKGLMLTVDAADVPDALVGDATRLSQALHNLLSNAVKFTEAGRVEVRAEVLERDGPGLLLCLRVRDTGIGIAPAQLERLFDAFVQSDTSTTRRFGGTGLGLALTRRLALLLGGQAGASSEPGVGSEFWISARLREGEGTGEPAPALAAPDALSAPDEADADAVRRHAGGARVLLVDDDPVAQGMALELLHWAGLEVEAVDDGAQAVDAAAARVHALVLMDLRMPGMDGCEAARRIHALPGRGAVPIVALTGRDTAADRAACAAAGMLDHVPKPINPGRLFAALLRWLPGRSARVSNVAGACAAPTKLTDAVEAPAVALPPPLPAITGLDAALALRYLGGQAGLYRRVLEQFATHYGTELAAARQRLAEGDTAALAALAHGLWGSAEPIGAPGLAQRARALERVVADGASATTLAAAGGTLLDELQELLEAIRAGLAGGETAALVPEAAGTADEGQLNELARLLLDGDYRAVALWRTLAPALRRTHAAAASAIDARLLGFDFEGAAGVLEGMRRG